MKKRFGILSDPRFHLVYEEHRPFSDGPAPGKIRLNREGFTVVPGVKKKTVVYPGMLLAEHPSLEKGDLHAPIFGIITEISVRSIFIDALNESELDRSTYVLPEPRYLLSENISGEELILTVKRMGVNTRSLGRHTTTLIINGLNPEPGVTWAEAMLEDHCREIQAGLELHRRFHRAEKLLLAVPDGVQVSFDGVEIVHVKPEYPNSIDQLLIREVTGQENPQGFAVVGIHNVWSLGRVAVTGLPLMETVITIGAVGNQANYIVKNGSLVGELMAFAGVSLKNGDTILRGGPLRGESLDKLSRSITKGSYGFFVVPAGEVPPMEGNSSCVNCGACIRVCPTRIDPRMLSRYAEFARYEYSRKENFRLCVDCGLCGYVCIARRPVLQYIRLAISKLEQEDAMSRLTPVVPVSKG